MAIFSSDEGQGETVAERVAIIGSKSLNRFLHISGWFYACFLGARIDINTIFFLRTRISLLLNSKRQIVDIGLVICFSFSWIVIFSTRKLILSCWSRTRIRKQDIQAGNMPFQTNPSKPNRGSWKSPPLGQESIELTTNPQGLPPPTSRRDNLQNEHGKRRPMPTQPTDPKIRMLPEIDDAAIGGNGLLGSCDNKLSQAAPTPLAEIAHSSEKSPSDLNTSVHGSVALRWSVWVRAF
jgi:hypothetical protein